MKIVIVGPTGGKGGISTVINSVVSAGEWHNVSLYQISTSVYKDGGILDEIKYFSLGLLDFIRLLLFESIDLVHIHASHSISFFRKSIFTMCAFIFHKRVIFHIHSSCFDGFYLYQNNVLIRRFIQWLLRSTTINIVLCNDWMDKLKRCYNLSNVLAIRNPNPNEFLFRNMTFNRDHIRFLFVGFYIEPKGIIDLITSSCHIFRLGFDNFSVMLCGKGELNNQINTIIRQQKLEKIIVNRGWVSGHDKDLVYKNSDVFVLPSYREGMPIVILEAFSYGLPVISTNIAGIPEMIRHKVNGLLVTPGDTQGLAEAMIVMIKDIQLRKRMSQENLNYVQHFSAQKVAQEWRMLYRELLSP